MSHPEPGTGMTLGVPLRVAINAQFSPAAGAGGVETALIGLVRSLGELSDGPEEYVIVGPWDDPEWLKPYLGPNQRIAAGPNPSLSSRRGRLGLFSPLVRKARGLLESAVPNSRSWPEVPLSNGFYEALGCQVIHFPYQSYTVCGLPTIFNPHDLQHLHYPEFFTPSTIANRETIYPAGCHLAQAVVVGSQWVKQDIIDHYCINPGKIQVIPWAPPSYAHPDPGPGMLAEVSQAYCLETPYAIYPSVTWEHKNHIRLLEALALLRDRDKLKVNLVCTGHQNDFYRRIHERLQSLRLANQVKFLGMVPGDHLRALYRLAQFVVVPTLFEAASGPLFEAWLEGTPAACSTVTSLPEQAGDAALLFDPFSVESIAHAVALLATDPLLREQLRDRGTARLQDFSWRRTAQAYRAVYRRASRRTLSEEDRWLLSWDWMRNPGMVREPG